MSLPTLVTEVRSELRCHFCSHAVGFAATAMRMVGLFRPFAFGVIPTAQAGEVRRKCRKCGWTTIFHPLTASRHLDIVEVK